MSAFLSRDHVIGDRGANRRWDESRDRNADKVMQVPCRLTYLNSAGRIGSELCSTKIFTMKTLTGAHFGAIQRPWEADNAPVTVLKNPIFGGQYLPYFQDSSVEFLRAGTKLAKLLADFRILTISSRTKMVAKMSRFWDPQPKTAKSWRNQNISLSGENLALILHFLLLEHISKPIFYARKKLRKFLKNCQKSP